MDYKKIMIIILCLSMISCVPLAVVGVAGLGAGFGAGGFSHIQKLMRKPGEKIIEGPSAIWIEHKCDDKNLPFMMLEKNELIPLKIKPGDELNHHFVYAMCPVRPTEVIQGHLFRNILFRGNVIFQDKSNFEMKPGRWEVDAFITVPKDAETGIYALEAVFESQSSDMGKHEVFRNVQTIIVDK